MNNRATFGDQRRESAIRGGAARSSGTLVAVEPSKAMASRGKRSPPGTIHRQTWIKVNAHVDVGVAPLVTALSAFPMLRTLESCQGTNGSAWVTFVYGEDAEWKSLCDFVCAFLGPCLAKEFGDRVQTSVQVTTAGRLRGEMVVNAGSVPAVVQALVKLSEMHS